jgi:hypothetical protein
MKQIKKMIERLKKWFMEITSTMDYLLPLPEDGEQGEKGDKGDPGQTLYTWIKYADSATGSGISDGPVGKTYIGFAYNKTTAAESNDPGDYMWSLIKGTDGVPGERGEDGTQYYTWIKYSNYYNGNNMYDTPNSSTAYIGIAVNQTTAIEGTDPSAYTWSRFKGDQGVPGDKGDKGDPGDSLYTWIKYADNATGSGLSDSPTGKEYIGFAYNKSTPVESTNPADYLWALIKGTDGVPGERGEDGTQYYTWIKYSDYSDGTNLYNTPTSNTMYIGIAVNKTTATESTNKSDYTWSKFKGDQGVPGEKGDKGDPGNTGARGMLVYMAGDYDATKTYTATAYVAPCVLFNSLYYVMNKQGDWLGTNKGDTPADDYAQNGVNATWLPMDNFEYIFVKVLMAQFGLIGTAVFYDDWMFSQMGIDEDGNDSDQYQLFDPDVDGDRYTWIKYANSATGSSMSDSPSGKYYIGIAYNKTTGTKSTVASNYRWTSLSTTGGISDGSGKYTWIKFSNYADGTSMYNTPTTGTLYIGIALNKTTATESSSPDDYAWYPVSSQNGLKNRRFTPNIALNFRTGAGHFAHGLIEWTAQGILMQKTPWIKVTRNLVSEAYDNGYALGSTVPMKLWRGSYVNTMGTTSDPLSQFTFKLPNASDYPDGYQIVFPRVATTRSYYGDCPIISDSIMQDSNGNTVTKMAFVQGTGSPDGTITAQSGTWRFSEGFTDES